MQGVQSLTPIMNRKKHWQQLSAQKGLQRPKAADILNMGADILSAYMLASVSGIKLILGKMRGSSEDWKLSIV
jgi:hypothetical protein